MSTEIKVALKEARKAFKQNDYSDAIKKCKEILKKDKDNYGAFVLLAASMKQIEEYNAQVPLILQKAIQIQPDNPLAWQGLAAYYEKHCNSNDCCSKLMPAYCKLLQMDSDYSDFSYILDKVSELSLKLKDNTLLVPVIESLSELREKVLHNEKVKLINKLLEQILINNFNNLTEHLDLLKSVLKSLINDADISSRQEYCGKYLKLLYDEGELMTLREEAINMHQQFPQDTLPLGNLYKANEAYSQAQRADPAYINSWIGQALIAEMMSRKDAMDLFRHSTQLGYHDQAAVGYTHWVLTVLLNSSTKKDSLYTYMIENMHAIYVAADVMNWYIEHHPDDYYARNAYGLLLERQHLYKSAAEQFTVAVCLSLNEEKDLACINLARVLIQLNKYSEAVKLCRAVKGNNYNSQCHLALSLLKDAQYEDSYTAYEDALRLFANTGIEKAYTLCAMAAIAYTFQGVNDAKTLLFQCIQVQPPIIAAFLAAASLGILHGDLNLTTLVLNELKPYENNPEYGLHVANLTAYFHLIGNNTKSAVAILSKATFRHPGDVRYWVQLLKVLLQTDLQTFNKCAQKTLFLSRNIADTNIIHVACASSLSYFAQNLDTNSSRSIQKLLFTYPSHVESWATFITAFLPRSVNMDSTWSVQWISVLTSIILNYQCTDSMVKWLCDSKQKLTQFI